MSEANKRVILTTRRLLLRPAYKQDAEMLFKAFSDPEVMKYWDTPPHASVADTESFVEKMMANPENGVTDFVICRTSNSFPTSPEVSAGSSGSTTSCSTPQSAQSGSGSGDSAGPVAEQSFENPEPSSPVIGKVGIWNSANSEIGFLLARSYWRQGLISEALSILLPYYFDKVGFEKITADIDPENVGSRALLEKFGFHVVGRRANTFCIAGVWVDSLDLVLTKEDFIKRRSG